MDSTFTTANMALSRPAERLRTLLFVKAVVYSVPPSTSRPQIQPNLAPERKSIQGISLAQPHGCVVYRVRRTARRRRLRRVRRLQRLYKNSEITRLAGRQSDRQCS